jgi:hypothetical protein
MRGRFSRNAASSFERDHPAAREAGAPSSDPLSRAFYQLEERLTRIALGHARVEPDLPRVPAVSEEFV